MTRQEHLDWCKQRAIEYVRIGDVNQAFTSMVSDLGKHDETRNHAGCELGMMMLMSGKLNSPREMENFINGFN